MSQQPATTLATMGAAIERRFVEVLNARAIDKYAKYLDLKNLKGESTGYIRVYSGVDLEKASSLSIQLGPFGRYFNINIIPDIHLDAPRFTVEGMLSSHGSQISIDLYPDVDPIMNFQRFMADYSGVEKIFKEATENADLVFRPSYQAHIRALCSPFFLCTFGAAESALTALEDYADRYFSEWLNIYRQGRRLTAEEAAARQERRDRIARTIMSMDPDRDMVVKIFGEETTQAIQDATMV